MNSALPQWISMDVKMPSYRFATSGSSTFANMMYWMETMKGPDLSRRTFQALQDFNPWLHSVLRIVTHYVVTIVTLLWSQLSSGHGPVPPCVVLGCLLTVLKIMCTPWGEILHRAPGQGRLSVILNLLNFKIIAPTEDLFSSCCLPIVEWLILGLRRCTILSLDWSLVLAIVEAVCLKASFMRLLFKANNADCQY